MTLPKFEAKINSWSKNSDNSYYILIEIMALGVIEGFHLVPKFQNDRAATRTTQMVWKNDQRDLVLDDDTAKAIQRVVDSDDTGLPELLDIQFNHWRTK